MLMWGLILLFAAGVVLVVEVFLPSAGLLAVVACGLAISGVVCLFRHDWRWGAAGASAVVILGPLIFLLGLQMLPSTPMGRRLLFGDSPDTAPDEPDPGANEFEGLIGKEGVALTDLRPVGAVKIDGRRFDALSEVAIIRAGTPVRVTQVLGFEVKVRPLA